jgi:hypothetical protein
MSSSWCKWRAGPEVLVTERRLYYAASRLTDYWAKPSRKNLRIGSISYISKWRSTLVRRSTNRQSGVTSSDLIGFSVTLTGNTYVHKKYLGSFKILTFIICSSWPYRVVLQVIQATESWDRLLIELPGQVSSLWNERNELRNVYGSVSALCHYYNYIVEGNWTRLNF